MKCQILFSGKNKKNISKCRLLKILPRVLSVKEYADTLFIDCPNSQTSWLTLISYIINYIFSQREKKCYSTEQSIRDKSSTTSCCCSMCTDCNIISYSGYS